MSDSVRAEAQRNERAFLSKVQYLTNVHLTEVLKRSLTIDLERDENEREGNVCRIK